MRAKYKKHSEPSFKATVHISHLHIVYWGAHHHVKRKELSGWNELTRDRHFIILFLQVIPMSFKSTWFTWPYRAIDDIVLLPKRNVQWCRNAWPLLWVPCNICMYTEVPDNVCESQQCLHWHSISANIRPWISSKDKPVPWLECSHRILCVFALLLALLAMAKNFIW